jgi:hypothetical protein
MAGIRLTVAPYWLWYGARKLDGKEHDRSGRYAAVITRSFGPRIRIPGGFVTARNTTGLPSWCINKVL